MSFCLLFNRSTIHLAFYIIFQSHNNEKGNNYFEDPIQSILAMFIMSLQEFGDIYNEFENTQLPVLAKVS